MPASDEYTLLGIENPLLDISAVVPTTLLEKYELKANDAILAADSHKPLYKELIDNHNPIYIAGGAAQNTLRGAQWLLPPKSTVYIGAVGKDDTAETLRKVAAEDGLRTEYMVNEEVPTGKCAVLITGHHRSLCTDLLAANTYKKEHIQKKEIWALVENAKFFYVGGYFLTVSPDTANLIAEHAAETGKTFMMNMSAPFIPQFFTKQLDDLAPYWDVIFGNEAEAHSYAQSHNLPHTHEEIPAIALHLLTLPKKTTKPRTVVITQGREPTIVAHYVAGVPKVDLYPVHEVPESEIVDTNGAGDAFCGGFLAALVKGKSIKECVEAGQYVAAVVIKRNGPSYPREAPAISYRA
ncbi:adenosine kinase [Phlyctochytrium planicorne]|nr:adenosine kinase [Phlyctochytrium planicorne]